MIFGLCHEDEMKLGQMIPMCILYRFQCNLPFFSFPPFYFVSLHLHFSYSPRGHSPLTPIVSAWYVPCWSLINHLSMCTVCPRSPVPFDIKWVKTSWTYRIFQFQLVEINIKMFKSVRILLSSPSWPTSTIWHPRVRY